VSATALTNRSNKATGVRDVLFPVFRISPPGRRGVFHVDLGTSRLATYASADYFRQLKITVQICSPPCSSLGRFAPQLRVSALIIKQFV
jgi:hypothetical protein